MSQVALCGEFPERAGFRFVLFAAQTAIIRTSTKCARRAVNSTGAAQSEGGFRVSGAHDSKGQDQGASTWRPVISLEAPQARAIAAILEAFDTGEPDNPPCVHLWPGETNPDLTVTVHAGLRGFREPPDDDLEVCIDAEGRIYGYEVEADTVHWLVPVRLDQPTARCPYRAALICYRSDPPSSPEALKGEQG